MGDDVYVVASGDVPTELANAGFDTIHTGLASYTLTANFDALVYTGTAAFRGIGSQLANNIVGGSGNDTLTGGSGNDTIHGGQGNDSLYGDIGDDVLVAGAGNESMTGYSGSDIFVASAQHIVSTALINEFTRGQDRLDLRGMGATTFDEAMALARASSDGSHTVFSAMGETVTVRWVMLQSWAEADFVLGDRPVVTVTGIRLSNPDFDENQAAGTQVGTLLGETSPRAAALGYTLENDAGGQFAIVGRMLVATGLLDFETQAFHDIVVRATDETGGTTTRTLRINVTDANDAPVMAAAAAATLPENTTSRTVLTLSATDQDAGDNVSGAFAGGFQFAAGPNDNAQFAISGASLLYRGEPLNFEDPLVQHSFAVDLQAIDAVGALSAVQRVTVTLTDVNETPTVQVPATASFDENTTNEPVALLMPGDPDSGDTPTVEFAPGTNDNALFSLVDNQLVYVGPAVNFEDSSAQKLFRVDVQVRDSSGLLSPVSTVTVSVRDVNEAPSVGAPASATLQEGGTGVVAATLWPTDPDAGDVAQLQWVGTQNDNGLFQLSGNQLVYVGDVLDFEDPAQPKSLKVQVEAIDSRGMASAPVTITVNVTNRNEAPSVIAPEAGVIAENTTGGLVATVSANDPDAGDTAAVQFAPGTNDNSSFSLVANELRYVGPALNYEDPAAQKSFTVSMRSVDTAGLVSPSWTMLVSLADVNEAPSALRLSSSSVAATAPAGTVVGTLSAADPDTGDTLSYALLDNAGGHFAVVDGALVTTGPLDAISYTVTASATDAGGLSTQASFAIMVNVVSVTVKGTAGNDLITPTATVAGEPFPGLGNDTIAASGGNDTIDGGVGADSMVGGAGDDLFHVDNAGDICVEASKGGTDTVNSAIDIVLRAEIEKLVLSGAAVSGTGNGLANTLTGTRAAIC